MNKNYENTLKHLTNLTNYELNTLKKDIDKIKLNRQYKRASELVGNIQSNLRKLSDVMPYVNLIMPFLIEQDDNTSAINTYELSEAFGALKCHLLEEQS